MEASPQYLTDVNGKKIAVVLEIEAYEQLLEELDELRCQQGYQQAVRETEPEIQSGEYVTLDQYLNLNATES